MAERSQRLWWPRPTARGIAFLAVGAILFLYGLLGERKDVLFVGCFLLAIPIVAMGYVLLRRMRVHVSRSFSPPIVAAGSESVVSLTVQNLSSRPSYGARWADAAEPGIRVPESTLLPSLGKSRKVDDRDTARLEYTITPRRRGVYGIGPLQLTRTDPFGLASGRQSVGEPHDIVVTPRVTALPGSALSLTSSDGSMHELLRNTHPNADELIAREYRPGDPLRRMNWPATARHGELMVRQEEQRSNPEARIVLDTSLSGRFVGTDSTSDRRGRLSAAFELALELAASVGIHLLEAGFRVEVVETGPSQLSPAADRIRGGLHGDAATAYRVPAGDREFLEGLANLRIPSRATTDATVSAGTGLGGGNLRLPTFVILVDPDEREARELASVRSSCEPAIAFVIDTVDAPIIDRLEDAGWLCVPLRSPRGIPQAWEAAQNRRSVVDEPV